MVKIFLRAWLISLLWTVIFFTEMSLGAITIKRLQGVVEVLKDPDLELSSDVKVGDDRSDYTIQLYAGAYWKKYQVVEGDTISGNDILSTAVNSKALVSWGDSNLVILDNNTKLSFSRILDGNNETPQSSSTLNLVQGSIRVYFQEKTAAPLTLRSRSLHLVTEYADFMLRHLEKKSELIVFTGKIFASPIEKEEWHVWRGNGDGNANHLQRTAMGSGEKIEYREPISESELLELKKSFTLDAIDQMEQERRLFNKGKVIIADLVRARKLSHGMDLPDISYQPSQIFHEGPSSAGSLFSPWGHDPWLLSLRMGVARFSYAVAKPQGVGNIVGQGLGLAIHTRPLPWAFAFAEMVLGSWEIRDFDHLLAEGQAAVINHEYFHNSLGVGARYVWGAWNGALSLSYITGRTVVLKYPMVLDENYLFKLRFAAQWAPELSVSYNIAQKWEIFMNYGYSQAEVGIIGLNEGGGSHIVVTSSWYKLGFAYRLAESQ